MGGNTAKFIAANGLTALATSLLALTLLGGCVEHDPPATEAPGALSGLRPTGPAYTNHQALLASPEPTDVAIVPIRIGDGFTLVQRAKILRAVNEWNYVLNGYARFDIVPTPAEGGPAGVLARGWMVMPLPGVVPHAMRAMLGDVLATTVGTPASGGLVTVFVDRVWKADLGDVMRHELGHVLGLGHDPQGRLMAAYYRPDHQRCIDRSAAAAFAALHGLPLSALNWCGA